MALHVLWAESALLKSQAVEEKKGPIAKVIKMLKDLLDDVKDEAKKEAKSYDKFACFCKDKTEDRSEKITDGESTIDENAATIEEQTEKKGQEERNLQKAKDDIEKLSSEIKEAELMRAKEKAEYDAVIADLSKAVDSIENAIKALSLAQMSPEFLQAKNVNANLEQIRKTIRKSVALADMLGVKPKLRRALHALMQTSDPEVPENEYESHTGEIVEVLEDLKKDFEANKEEKEEEGKKAKESHDELMEKKTSAMDTADGQKTDAEEAIEECKTTITEATETLIQAQKDLEDDQAYLKDLTKRCETKAKEWDQRSAMRANEIEALSKALDIIKGAKGKLPGKKKDLLLQDRGEQSSIAVSPEPHGLSLAEADVGDLGLSLIQETKSPREQVAKLLQKAPLNLTPDERREKALSLLATEATRLNSAILKAFVTNVAPDPFKKVKALITKMIQELMQEAVDQANHKGFCDSEIATAMGHRDNLAEKSSSLRARLEQLAVDKEELEELIEDTEADLKDLNAALEKATKMREDEKEDNAETLKEATEGRDAIKSAIEVLEDFYRGARHKKITFVQTVDSTWSIHTFVQRSSEDPPGGEPKGSYTGNQEGGRKIIEMLQKVLQNFEDSIKEVEAADAKSRQEFVDFERTSKSSIMEKETGKAQAEADLKANDIATVQAHEDLEDTQKQLDLALKELEQLRPACDLGASFKERAEARDKEIEALKKAICILDSPDPSDNDC